jgi:hypothetical protein
MMQRGEARSAPSRGKRVVYKADWAADTKCLRCSLPIYDIPDLVFIAPSSFVSALTHSFASSIFHKIGNILFGPSAFSLVDTDRPP